MDEELIDYFFGFAQSKGFKKNREDFVKYLQSDDELFDYLYGVAESKGYKRDKEHFAGLVGRTKNATPVSTETVNTEPAKTTETVTEETTTDFSKVDTTPMESKSVESLPVKESEEPTVAKVDLTDKEKADRLKDVTEAKKNAMADDVSSKLMPVTEKTQVKEVAPEEKKKEVPTDIKVKDVTTEEQGKGIKIKSKDKKELSNTPLETIKLKPGEYTVDIPNKVPGKEMLPKEVYKPYGEKGPDVYYSKDNDQYIIKNGDERILINKGSSKYDEITDKINRSVSSTKEGKSNCDTPPFIGCSKENTALRDFVYYYGDDYDTGFGTPYEENLISELDRRKKRFEEHNETVQGAWNYDPEGQIWYASENLPKDKRFITYKPYGNDNTLIYDKSSGVILEQLDKKAPLIDVDKQSSKVFDTKGNVVREGKDPRQVWKQYTKDNPNEGLTVWKGYEFDHPKYKELKSLIDGIEYKKQKGTKNIFVPLSPEFDPTGTPDWMKSQSPINQQPKIEEKKTEPVKEIKTEPVKNETKSDIPSYDDLGINPEKDPGDFLGANFDKNTKFEKMSPAELIEKDIFKDRGDRIKLERNVSLRYPDPPGVVLKKENIGGKEVYSSYDKENDKWYIYDEKSNKDNWTEVKAGPIKSMLNVKYKKNNNIIDSKIDYNSDEEDKKISKIKEGILLNKYLPYVMKNWDNLSEEQKQKIKLDIADSSYSWIIRKSLERNDPNLEFWVDVNNKLINNQAISSNIIDVYDKGKEKNYTTIMFEIPTLNKNIKEGKLEILNSIAGDVLYDKKNDVFYYGDSFTKDELKKEKTMYSKEDGEGYEEGIARKYLKTIPKGTPAYDKIKNSLSKYNK